jgi:hypothetical protein
LAFLYSVERKSWFFVMAPVSIMTVIEKSNGIVTDHRCKIIIENPPAVIWHTYIVVCPFLFEHGGSLN